jgi:hypothetical protein
MERGQPAGTPLEKPATIHEAVEPLGMIRVSVTMDFDET